MFPKSNELLKYPALESFGKTNTYYTYMSIMEQFKDMIIDVDMNLILEDDIGFIYIENSIPFRKRYMNLHGFGKRLSDREMSAVKTPLLAVQGSVLDSGSYDSIFCTDFFNTDMSNVGIAGYGDVVFSRIDDSLDVDCSCILIPKQGSMNIEITIMEDSVQKLENVREAWNKVRRNEQPDTFIGGIECIFPMELAIQLMMEFKLVKELDDLSKMTYRDVYNTLRPYAATDIILDYKVDTSTSKEEIFIRYPYEVLVQPTMINYTPPSLSEWVLEGGLLTRGFTLTFSMASMYQLHNARYVNRFRKSISEIIRENTVSVAKSEPVQTKTDNGVCISGLASSESIGGSSNPEIRFETNDESIIFTAVYKGMEDKEHLIDVVMLIPDNMKSFMAKLKDINYPIERHFTTIVQILGDDGVYSMMSNKDYTVDYIENTITIHNMLETSYSISMYVDLLEYQRFLFSDEYI